MSLPERVRTIMRRLADSQKPANIGTLDTDIALTSR